MARVYVGVNAFINANDRNVVWADVTYVDQRRTLQTASNHTIMKFNSYEELQKFWKANCDTKVQYANFSYAYFKDYKESIVNYIRIEYRRCIDNPSLDKLVLYYVDYNDPTVKSVEFPGSYKDIIIDAMKKNRGITGDITRMYGLYDERNSFYSDWIRSTPRSELKQMPISRPSKVKIPISEKNIYDFIDDVKSIPKNASRIAMNFAGKITIKRLVLFSTVLASIFVGSKVGGRLYKLEKNGYNGADFLFLDERKSRTDEELCLNRDAIVPMVESLAGFDNEQLSQRNIIKVMDYLKTYVGTDFDNNESFNRINLRDLIARKGDTIQEIQDEAALKNLMDKIQNKYESCFDRPHPKDNNLVLNQEQAPKFLNLVLPLIIFSEDYVNRPTSQAPRNYESFNSSHASQQEIELYAKLPDVVKDIILCQAKEVYRRTNDYNFKHAGYMGDSDVMKKLDKIAEAIRIRLLLSASDNVVLQEEANRVL